MGNTNSQVSAGYWAFQIINTLSSASFVFFPEASHRSLMPNPDEMLSTFGFGPLQHGFLLNQVRGWNTALLAISLYGYTKGQTSKDFLGLACLTSLTTTYAHIMTGIHHTKEKQVAIYLKKQGMNPFGPAFVTSFLALATGWAFYKSK